MLYFLEKAEKNHRSVGLRRLGLRPPDPQVVTLAQLTCYFWALLWFLDIAKITTYYFTLERRL